VEQQRVEQVLKGEGAADMFSDAMDKEGLLSDSTDVSKSETTHEEITIGRKEL
jgi:hypothetical protein